jgi:CheY-like chemotaxis protein
MNDHAANLFAGHMGVCAVLVDVLIDKGIISRSEFCDRFQQARLAASQCSAGPMVADALAEMVEYLRHSPPSQTSPAADRPILDGQTILLVEEQPIILRHLQKALEAAGAEVLMAHTAAEALPRIEQFDVSAAVLDWDPDCSESRTLTRRLQESGVQFIFCATRPPEDVATRRGAAILRKPVRPNEIVKAVTLLVAASGSI